MAIGGATVQERWAAVGDRLEALGEAVSDEAVRADLRDAGRLLVDAVNSTLDEVGATVRRRSDA